MTLYFNKYSDFKCLYKILVLQVYLYIQKNEVLNNHNVSQLSFF